MIGKRLYAVWPLGLALFIAGCGDPVPPATAVITPVEPNRTTTYTNSDGATQVVDGAIHFKVQVSSTDTTPVLGVMVELSGSSPFVGDPFAGFVGGGGGFVNPADPNNMTATTNSSGVVAASYQFTVPKCSVTQDLTFTASISASAGGSATTWTDTIKVPKEPTC